MSTSAVNFTKSDLIGTWKNSISSSADFTLEQDSAKFHQENPFTKYSYDIKGDSLIINFPKFSFGFKVVYFNDSIHLMNAMSTNTFLRVRN